jgi:hypothetical protein
MLKLEKLDVSALQLNSSVVLITVGVAMNFIGGSSANRGILEGATGKVITHGPRPGNPPGRMFEDLIEPLDPLALGLSYVSHRYHCITLRFQ